MASETTETSNLSDLIKNIRINVTPERTSDETKPSDSSLPIVTSPRKPSITTPSSLPSPPPGKPLSMIPISVYGDDSMQVIPCYWYNLQPIVRIATIGDGSCFFHAVIKAFDGDYVRMNTKQRKEYVARFRRDLAYNLTIVDPRTDEKRADGTPKTLYDTAMKGTFVEYYQVQQLLIKDYLEERGLTLTSGVVIPPNLGGIQVDYSLSGLMAFLNSHQHVGDEMFGYIAEMLTLNVLVFIATDKTLLPVISVTDEEAEARGLFRPTVIISGTTMHYELIGINLGPEQGIQTIFMEGDPFLVKARQQFKR